MALIPGTRLGPYEILSALGAGGMGEVYRAHDTKLNRDVAIKILPDAPSQAILALEGAPPAEHLEQDGTKRPDIAALVHRTAFGLLRAHVGGRAEDHADAGHQRW